MIIQELCHYYDRLAENPDIKISPPGFSREKIHAEIVLDQKGHLLQFNDLRIQKNKKKVPREMIVPQSCKRPGAKPYEKPFFLWDNTGFVIGKDAKDDEGMTKFKFDYFRKFNTKLLSNETEPEIKSFLKFLTDWNPSEIENLTNWKDILGGNIVFRIDGEREFLHEKRSAKDIWLRYIATQESIFKGFCLVTGKQASIARLHPAIKGFSGTGSALVCFEDDAYKSYGKERNYNAPVSEYSAFCYTTTLNYLLSSDSKQKIKVGDTTAIFWTERESPIEGMFGMMLDPKETDIADNVELRQTLEAVREGKPLANMDPDVKFFILGLSPNKTRLAVRFWHVCSVGELEDRIGQHFCDLQLQRSFDSDPAFPGIRRILWETYNKKSKTETASPLLAGTLMRCILEGTIYPQSLQNAVINRMRADQEINYVRASILKAILVRKYRLYKQGMEVSMALDTENKNPAYLLGRLFATLEKVQEEASPGINATIKDRFWGSASATPKVAFPQLLNLNNHHISKIDNPGKAVFFKKLIGDIMDGIESKGFKAHLSLDEQGLFAIGYYHQRQDFFKSKESRKNDQQ